MLVEGGVDFQSAFGEVEVLPLEPDHLAAPQARGDVEEVERLHPVAADRLQQQHGVRDGEARLLLVLFLWGFAHLATFFLTRSAPSASWSAFGIVVCM